MTRPARRRRRSQPRTWCALREFENAIEPAVQWLAAAWVIIVVLDFLAVRSRAVEIAETALWIFFVVDLAVRIVLAPDRIGFLRRNWLTVLATALPALRLLRTVRALRLLRAARWARIVRVAGTVNRSAAALKRTLARRRVTYATGLTVVVWFVSSAAVHAFEHHAQPSAFPDLGSALWWTAMMLATMGSDRWPITTEGRVLAFFLAVYAFAVFGFLTAALATLFIANDADKGGSASPAAA